MTNDEKSRQSPKQVQPEKPQWVEIFNRARAKAEAAQVGQPVKQTLPMEDEAPIVAAAVRQDVAPKGKAAPEQGWMTVAPMPRDLCRCSPFFPLNRNQLKQRDFLEELVIAQSSWGRVTYTGPRLSVYEEDVLLAVLAVLDAQYRPETVTEDGRKAFTYKGPIRPLIQALGYPRPSKAEYARFRRALRFLMATALEITTKKGSWATTNIVSAAFGKGEDICITVNPYFHEMYAAGSITLLDVSTRLKLSGDVAKALHRFVSSHRDPRWQGHVLTLAGALNLNPDQLPKETRRQIKRAVVALVKAGVLDGRISGLKGDVVILARVLVSLEIKGEKALPVE